MTTATAHPISSTAPAHRGWKRLLAACRLEDGARWALIGALVGLAILAALIA
jgi:hypothetical protein